MILSKVRRCNLSLSERLKFFLCIVFSNASMMNPYSYFNLTVLPKLSHLGEISTETDIPSSSFVQ